MKKILPSFTLVGMFSLFPLLKREDQIMPYYLTIFLFYTISKLFISLIQKKSNNNNNKFLFLEIFIFLIMITYHIIECRISPPEKYPWIYPMINALFCFSFFFGLFLYSNYSLIKIIFKEKNKI